ncbi:hypothetical protein EA004_27150 [Vibrio anguillarum]|uniref:hypothetical protein n=1 Tax=Vibrio anguillarum TaxID=55601 RepID=UPI000BB4D0A7|nr:hypothetical protein [Vibrio anguillarum]EKO3612101.1 hypothetical protein [Vibrio metschnikovii]ATC60281.1 hypothetical protein CMV05_23105 [Vibrio anguillarum]MBF4248610.1 hypothetical protein [Vibrio anguillarum]MBF4249504.1 hypothetical protein [Vibrio anguillarum]MBF4307539.1 hypothetical protein [Vibrio anguillarum]
MTISEMTKPELENVVRGKALTPEQRLWCTSLLARQHAPAIFKFAEDVPDWQIAERVLEELESPLDSSRRTVMGGLKGVTIINGGYR